LGKVTHVLQTNLYMFDSLSPQLHKVWKWLSICEKEANRLSPRLCSKVKETLVAAAWYNGSLFDLAILR